MHAVKKSETIGRVAAFLAVGPDRVSVRRGRKQRLYRPGDVDDEELVVAGSY